MKFRLVGAVAHNPEFQRCVRIVGTYDSKRPNQQVNAVVGAQRLDIPDDKRAVAFFLERFK